MAKYCRLQGNLHCWGNSRFLSHFLTDPEHCVTIETPVPWWAVIISLILSLESSDGEGASVARSRARKPFRDPWGSIASTIDDCFRGLSLMLLVPVHTITITNIVAASSAGDGDSLAKRPRQWGWLSQHRLGPGCWKRKKYRGNIGVSKQEKEAGPSCS